MGSCMGISLDGIWKVSFYRKGKYEEAEIMLPQSLNGQGFGEPVSPDTLWNSGLHNPFWHEREEYQKGVCGEYKVSFLSQPPTHYAGEARYSRTTIVEQEGDYYLRIELSKWRLTLYLDDVCVGSEESLCAPFVFGPFHLEAGEHRMTVVVDNGMQHSYRPDGHGISDALNANWNGMGGEIVLLTAVEYQEREAAKKEYARLHPVSVQITGRTICINKKPEYMRGTHFGGDFPLTGMPSTDIGYWKKIFSTIVEYGFNFVRCHSFCPPEAAFLAADEMGIYIQVECGMWNTFFEGSPMLGILEEETRKILRAFGHHPSFVMLSPSNEPGGNWYQVLRDWVTFARNTDRELGYEGRRVYTAQSGWFYDVPPAQIQGTDYIYFHRSAFGPFRGGMIRSHWGWGGKDYSPSLTGCKLPVICHEMGQWCAYPDFDVISKFTGYARPGNFEIFKDTAEKNDVLQYNREFTYCSGRNQVRLLKEEFEANFRTAELTGYEYLDLHDYTGQGTALVGVLDAFWETKGYVSPEEFRRFNSEIVLLARIKSYVLTGDEVFAAPIEVCNFGKGMIPNPVLRWSITEEESNQTVFFGELECDGVPLGQNTLLGEVNCDFSKISRETLLQSSDDMKKEGRNAAGCFGKRLRFSVRLYEKAADEMLAENEWELTVFVKRAKEAAVREAAAKEAAVKEVYSGEGHGRILYTKSYETAKKALEEGKTVLFTPYLSDMDFECPNLSMKNVFWNAQMGPGWSRQLGIVVEEKHPALRRFATEHSGGWEWEDILHHARGYYFPAKYKSIVRVIDDWNRNYPLSLMFEGNVLNGKLLFVSADLEGDFETRPAAATLREALLDYIASKDFSPVQRIDPEDLFEHIRPLYQGSDIIQSVKVEQECGHTDDALMNLYDINPNHPLLLKPKQFPVSIRIKLRHPVDMQRLYYLPIQSDRDFPGVIKEYEIKLENRVIRGEFKNSLKTQWSEPIGELVGEFTLTVHSTYSMGEAVRFVERHGEWHRIKRVEPLCVSFAALGVEYTESEAALETLRHNDELFWSGQAKSRHREIDQ